MSETALWTADRNTKHALWQASHG